MLRHPSDSSEQRDAEVALIAGLSKELGVPLQKRELDLTTCVIQIDGYSENPPIMCEAWAHRGKPKGGQPHKVLTDAFKLLFADTVLGEIHRKILVFADEAARKPFGGDKWQAQCLKHFGFETYVVSLPKKRLEMIDRAQKRQRR